MKFKAGQPRLLIFKSVAILLPLILLVIIEVLLRYSGYGHNTDLFITDPTDARYMQVNPYASEKFFSDTINATKGSSEIFEVNKSAGTFRIFVLGESTTIGYPYFHNGAFHRWLQFRLMQMYPNRKFEIVNVAMTALNSYTVLDFGKQVLKYEPDAVMVYVGHNEYYGAMGVGSTSYGGGSRLWVRAITALRQLRIFQWLNNIYSGLKGGKIPDTRENLMKRMAAKQQIQYGSKLYNAGIEQFQQNMEELCRLYGDSYIPLFISNVVSNEKDQPPFISTGTGANSARWNYEAGQQAYQNGAFKKAKNYFINAKELDELRFRAPAAINQVITKLAKRYPSVHLVDAKSAFEQNSPNYIIGKETILEHVHPNLHGYGILSEAFFGSFNEQHMLTDTPIRQLTFKDIEKEMPLTRLDSLMGEYQIALLRKGWPFNVPLPASFGQPVDLADSLAYQVTFNRIQWKDAMDILYQRAVNKKDKPAQVKLVEAMTLEYPQNEQFCGLAASLNAEAGQFAMAALYYRALGRLHPDGRYPARAIKMYLKDNNVNAALTVVPELPSAQQDMVKAILTEIRADKALLNTNAKNKEAKERLVADYGKLGITDMP